MAYKLCFSELSQSQSTFVSIRCALGLSEEGPTSGSTLMGLRAMQY